MTTFLHQRLITTVVPAQNLTIKRPKVLGTTFSQLQCAYLGVDYQQAFNQIVSLGFNTIRLCSYWNEIEPQPSNYNFRKLDWLIEQSEKQSLRIILTVGMKAPRWPEFHFPDWIHDKYSTTRTSSRLDDVPDLANTALGFTETLVARYNSVSCIAFWQIENEPLNPVQIANRRHLSSKYIKKEIELVRLFSTHQKILLTNSIELAPIDLPEDDEALQNSILLADAIGLNVYNKVPLNSNIYLVALPIYWRKLAEWHTLITRNKREAWIAEAQAEPWEHGEVTHLNRDIYPSASPKRTKELVVYLAQIGYENVLLWGCEYWYLRLLQGSDNWWKTIADLIQA